MAYVPRSSFIPKEAGGAIPLQVRRRRTVHIFGLIATLALILSFLSAVGVFFYKNLLEGRLESAKAELNAMSSVDNESKIEEIRFYDTKLTIAHTLLNNHLATSLLFEELENSTKETVRFSSLDFTYDPGFEATLTLTGNTEEFAYVALQKMQYIDDQLFSEFVLQDVISSTEPVEDENPKNPKKDEVEEPQDDKVSFSVTGLFKKELLSYTGATQNASVNRSVGTSLPLDEDFLLEVTSSSSKAMEGTSTPQSAGGNVINTTP